MQKQTKIPYIEAANTLLMDSSVVDHPEARAIVTHWLENTGEEPIGMPPGTAASWTKALTLHHGARDRKRLRQNDRSLFSHRQPKRQGIEILPESRYPSRPDASFRFIDLFAGIGGFRQAMQRNGGRCVFTSEWDQHSQQTYFMNYGTFPFGDIRQFTGQDEVTPGLRAPVIPDHDLLCAGFPCQPFSTIGKREGFKHPTQGTLFFDIFQILKAKRPRAFILENVPGLTNHMKGRTLKTIERHLARSVNGRRRRYRAKDCLDYHIFHSVLDAKNFGVPQHRDRLFIVGFCSQRFQKIPDFGFPAPEADPIPIGRFVEAAPEGYGISRHLQKVYIHKLDDGRPQIIDRSSTCQVKTLVASYHKIQRLTGTFVRGGKTGLRLLTHNECKAIMGYDADFQIPVSRTQMYRQMGNSVAVPVVEAIGRKMLPLVNPAP
jgi:DNA (cytosine-5)-methyltransferase 1